MTIINKGKEIKLPEMGGTLYVVDNSDYILPMFVSLTEVKITRAGILLRCDNLRTRIFSYYSADELGETLFVDRDEAEKVLEKRKKEKEAKEAV